ncbi:4'-phosphopantetheinyl transferase superfamily protein [Hymenobacter sp. BT664]|uniref:Enterobactin synthase component D n=1 Tax=Hymenobacter montanus TaxID=2771359 RepID=A0A927GLT9_9BACT|nr:4'-phosphopantetheinyl transferase superfamily protein [Hymenobacter montanus]MBD2770514.1 4'-phosphopantetheinyl transferase superfamily protein [Hymenobacter montanus]
MPLHSLQRLSPTAVLGLWHLTETPAELWAELPRPETYEGLLPVTADAKRQAQWLAGRVLTHAVLVELGISPTAQVVVQNDTTGRPWLTNIARDVTISMSHSGAWVAAVLARGGRAGVDVEMIRDKAQRIAGKFLSPVELSDAQAASAEHFEAASTLYTLLWSAKETLYKLAAQPGIIFKTQLLLDSFAPQESGEITATLVLGGEKTRHCICYCRPSAGYVLTYSHESAA